MDIKMRTGEVIGYIVLSRFREGFISIPGHVIVTSQRLLFHAHEDVFNNVILEISFSGIRDICAERSNAGEGLMLSSDNRISFFVMNGAGEIAKYIRRCKERMNSIKTIASSGAKEKSAVNKKKGHSECPKSVQK
jgi:hypothetical protein